MKNLLILFFSLVLCFGSHFSPEGAWKSENAHSSAQGALSHGHCNLPVAFRHFSAELTPTKGNGGVVYNHVLDFSLDMASLYIPGSDKRTDNMNATHFFDVKNHPAITFKGKDLFRLGNGWFHLRGSLTVKEVTKDVRFQLFAQEETFSAAQKSAVKVKIYGEINLYEFGVWAGDLNADKEMIKNETLFLNLDLKMKPPA